MASHDQQPSFADSSARREARSIQANCPAKVNLHLRVGPARADGFHPLLTWMCTVGLFDTLRMETAAGGDDANRRGSGSAVTLECDDAALPVDGRNLVVRAIEAVAAEHSNEAIEPIRAVLSKRIAAGAGLGGGSSDAATALRLANELWRRGREPMAVKELSALAARLGSDIPFFLHGPSAVCTGRGEIVRPVAPPRQARWAVLILSPVHMPTPGVYRRFDELKLGQEIDVTAEPEWSRWADLPAAALMARLVNDLESPAYSLRPDLGAMRESAEQTLGQPVRMSGSGSSHFTLCDAQVDALAMADRLATAPGMLVANIVVVEMAPTEPSAG